MIFWDLRSNFLLFLGRCPQQIYPAGVLLSEVHLCKLCLFEHRVLAQRSGASESWFETRWASKFMIFMIFRVRLDFAHIDENVPVA